MIVYNLGATDDLDHAFSVYRLTINIQADNMETLSDLLLSKIRAVDGVTKPNTCLVLNA